MYGKSLYDTWVSKFGITEADMRMVKYKENHKGIHSGANNGRYGKSKIDTLDIEALQKMLVDNTKMKDMCAKLNTTRFIINKAINKNKLL